MAASDPYFQFPLCCLSFPWDFKDRLRKIIDYSLVEYAQIWYAPPESGHFVRDVYLTPEENTEFLISAQKLKVRIESVEQTLQRHWDVDKRIRSFESDHGRDCLVRIKADFLLGARDGHMLTEREFRVLCALYSAIGNKKSPVRITRRTIQTRMMGYRSQGIFKRLVLCKHQKRNLLSIRQIGLTVDKLHSLNFFSRATYGRRVTYYSNRLTDAQLRTAIKKRFTYEPTFKSEMSAKDETMSEEIRRLKAEAKNA
jgi:hypothetical protein